MLLLVLVSVGATPLVVVCLAILLGVRAPAALLVAAGFAICGTSAVSAVTPLTGARREEVAYAVGPVTLCGTLSVALLRLLQGPVGLNDVAFGVWVSASVHDTGQVPEVVTELASPTRTLLLAVGPGAAVRARDVRRLGLRPLALGLLSWILLCGGTLAGVLAVGPR